MGELKIRDALKTVLQMAEIKYENSNADNEKERKEELSALRTIEQNFDKIVEPHEIGKRPDEEVYKALKTLCTEYILNPETENEFIAAITPAPGEIPWYWVRAKQAIKFYERCMKK